MNSFENLKKTFLIAEIGNNHEGSYKNAIKLIDKAKSSGVDAVKFQTFDTKNFINKLEKKRFSKLKSFELSKKDFSAILSVRILILAPKALDPLTEVPIPL